MSNNTESALVTGGAGFIGSHIVRKLIDEGLDVTVIDNLSVGSPTNVPTEARLVKGDIRDYKLITNLVVETDYIFHQAAKVSIRASIGQAHEDADVNLMGTLNVLRACRGSRVKKFFFASSMAVYSDSPVAVPVAEDWPTEPISPYGISKLAAEKYCLLMCRSFGIDCVVLRYFNTYGPRQTYSPYVGVITIFINQLLKGEELTIFGNGKQLRDFVHVDDIARANILALKSHGSSDVINVGTGRAISVVEIANLLRRRINPAADILYAEEQAGELRISFPNVAKAKKTIGFIPQWSLDDTIDEVITYIKECN